MPVATETPTRSVSGAICSRESSSAMRGAAMIICAKRSIRRAFLCSSHFVGSKSLTSQAKWTANSEGSNALIGAAPLLPAVRFVQKVSASFPSGVTAPIPVTTTRLLPFVLKVSSHPQAAVHEQDLARDERGLIRAEKTYRTGNVFRLPQAAEGGVLEDEAAGSLGQDVRELGGDVAGSNCVHAYSPRAQLARERLREPDDARLRRGVVGLARVPVHADDARDVHDRARPTAHHLARDGAGGVERPAQVRADNGLPVIVAHARDQRVSRHAGVVDERVDITELAFHPLDQLLRLLGVGDVGLDGHPAELVRDRLGR